MTEVTKKKLLAEEGQTEIQVGSVYRQKTVGNEVIPYNVDYAAAKVNIAGVGRSNEDIVNTSTFLQTYELVGSVSSRAEPQKDAKDNPPAEDPGTVVVKRNA